MSSTALDCLNFDLPPPLSIWGVLTMRLMGSNEKPLGGICRLAITALSFCVAQKASEPFQIKSSTSELKWSLM